jgi:hypothetical protein
MDNHSPRLDRRTDANFQRALTVGALVVALLGNVAAIAWGAGKTSAAVEQLNEIVKPLAKTVEQNTNDISVLKDRIQRGNNGAK